MKETPEARAVKIAAETLRKAGVCKYGSVTRCSRVYADERTCNKCLAGWLMAEARKQLEKEKR